MRKRLARALITTIVMSSFIVTPVLATPENEAQSLEIQKQAVESQANSVNGQLVDLLVQVNALRQDMKSQEEKIAQNENDLREAEEKEQKQYEDMKLRIKYLYEQGETTVLETIVSAKSYADLVSKSEYVQKIHEYDRNMLEEYIETRNEVASLKEELEAGWAEMESMEAALTSQQEGLESTLSVMRSQIADFDAQLAAAQAQAAAELEQLTENTANMDASINTKPVDSDPKGNADKGGSNTTNNNSTNNNATNNNSSTNSNAGAGNNANTNTNVNKPSNQGGTSGGSSSGSSNTPSQGNTALGQQIASKACTYVGNPYVYGGTSLTNGADCSGFVQSVHRLFGISTPRDSWGQLAGGKAVSYASMLPGDVIVYSDHVAIYIGGNKIVHASNSKPYPAGGIKISSPANYRTVLGVRRYW